MSSIVDHVFPPTSQSPQMALDYSSFTFWREPLPNIIAEEESTSGNTFAITESETEIAASGTEINEKSPSNSDGNINAKIGGGIGNNELDKSDTSSPSSSSSQTTIMENVNLETESNQINYPVH
jgi:hypothetical protein